MTSTILSNKITFGPESEVVEIGMTIYSSYIVVVTIKRTDGINGAFARFDHGVGKR